MIIEAERAFVFSSNDTTMYSNKADEFAVFCLVDILIQVVN